MTDLGSPDPLKKPEAALNIPGWVKVVPYFLSAFFFLSGFFLVFAPLPILFFDLRQGRRWSLLACLTNGVIVGLIGGLLSLGLYLVFVVVLSLFLAEMLKRRKSIEKSIGYTLVAMGLCSLILVGIYSQARHLNFVHEVDTQVSHFVEYIGQSVTSGSSLVNPADLDEWKRTIILEFPSAVAIFALIMVWANFVLLIRANPVGIRDRLGIDPGILKRWKAPELLVWPTILTGFFLLFDVGLVSDISLNIFRFLMAIYALQGLSILNFLFDLWGVKGFFRLVGYSLSLFLMMPLILSLGFFDLWFDFRGKFRQS